MRWGVSPSRGDVHAYVFNYRNLGSSTLVFTIIIVVIIISYD